MKEIIVIEKTKEFRPHPALREGVNCIDTKYCQYEQVPETFEELKEMCKKINVVCIVKTVFQEAISVNGVRFWDDGRILDNEEYLLAENRTLAQMWAIIKNLIGEE